MANHEDLGALLDDLNALTAERDEERRLRLAVETPVSASMLSSGLHRISAPSTPLSTRIHERAAALHALSETLSSVNDSHIASFSKSLADRETEVQALQDKLAALVAAGLDAHAAHSKSLSEKDAEISTLRASLAALDAQRPLLADHIRCASKLYDEVRQLVLLVDADAAAALPDSSVFVWKEADVEESTRMAFDVASMALHKVVRSRVVELQGRVDELVREKERIRVLLRSALQANITTEELKVAEDGLSEAGIEIGRLDGHRPGSADKDEVYTLAGALENSIKDSQIKIIEPQNLVEAQRKDSQDNNRGRDGEL